MTNDEAGSPKRRRKDSSFENSFVIRHSSLVIPGEAERLVAPKKLIRQYEEEDRLGG
jgi:hypothetical protein